MNICHSMLMYFSSLITFCLLNCYHRISAEAPPRKLAIANHKRITFAHVNQQLSLKCPIEMTDSLTFIEWFRGNTSLYMEQGFQFTQKGVLKIKSVTKQHAGTYTCEGINGYGMVRVNMTVIVDDPEVENLNNTPANPNSANRVHVYPPSIKKRQSINMVDDVGGQVTFHCIASGQPTPHIFFLKDDHLIQGAEIDISKGRIHSILKLRDLKKSDAGVYKCIARNKMGEDELDFTLQVRDPSSPPRIVALEPQSVTIKEGATAVFWCEVDSRPGLKLHIKWLKRVSKKDMGDSVKLDDITLFRSGATYYRPLNFSDDTSTNDGVYKSKLLIRNSCKEDSGAYVCLALNDKGFNFKNVTLNVISSGKALSSPSYFPASSTSLVVTITIAFVTILAAVVLVSHLYCRGRSPQKVDATFTTHKDPECGNLKQNIVSVRKHAKKDLIVYPEISDPQSTSKLLNSDLTYIYEHNDEVLSKSAQAKSFPH